MIQTSAWDDDPAPPLELPIRAAAQRSSQDPFANPFGDTPLELAQTPTSVQPSAERENPLEPRQLPAPSSPIDEPPFAPDRAFEDQESSEDPFRTDPEELARECGERGRICQEARAALGAGKNPIRNIGLDVTPLFKPDIESAVAAATENAPDKRKAMERSPTREWGDREGGVLASGRLREYLNDRVHIELDDGQIKEIPVSQLGEDDLCYLADAWNLPIECALGDEAIPTRHDWLACTLTWKASNACNKPLYFQEPQLERYGHTAGPIKQPVISGAHFFLNVAALPYWMGIHPPYECQYPLGYYRPGNCAPWLLSPVPLSLRGGLFQAGVVTGGIFALP